MNYRKYYKTKMYCTLRGEDLIPSLEKKFKTNIKMLWVTFDLATNRIILELLSPEVFRRLLSFERASKFRIMVNRIKYFLKFDRRANRKALQTELIKHVAIRAIVREDSETYKESKHKFEVLDGVINSTGLSQPVHISDNVGYTGSFTYLLSLTGRQDESTKLWDIWMKSKFTDADRKKHKTACLKALHDMIVIVKEKPKGGKNETKTEKTIQE